MYAKKRMKTGFALTGGLLALAIGAVLMGSRSLAANPIITEFMADNDDNVALGDIERGFGKPDPFGDGSAPAGGDFPPQVSNVSYGISPTTQLVGYLPTPTPGAANMFVDALTGPLISGVTENPGALADDQDLLVTAKVREHNASLGSVSLRYRIMFDV